MGKNLTTGKRIGSLSNCSECGGEFRLTGGLQMFCSPACARESQKKRQKAAYEELAAPKRELQFHFTCKNPKCNREFIITGNSKERKYCSRKCTRSHWQMLHPYQKKVKLCRGYHGYKCTEVVSGTTRRCPSCKRTNSQIKNSNRYAGQKASRAVFYSLMANPISGEVEDKRRRCSHCNEFIPSVRLSQNPNPDSVKYCSSDCCNKAASKRKSDASPPRVVKFTLGEAMLAIAGLRGTSEEFTGTVDYQSRCIEVDERFYANPRMAYDDFPGMTFYLTGESKFTLDEAMAEIKSLKGTPDEFTGRVDYMNRCIAVNSKFYTHPNSSYDNFVDFESYLGLEPSKFTLDEAMAEIKSLKGTPDEFTGRADYHTRACRVNRKFLSAPQKGYSDFPKWEDYLSLEKSKYTTIEEHSVAAIKLGITGCRDYSRKYKGDPKLTSDPTRLAGFTNWDAFLKRERRLEF